MRRSDGSSVGFFTMAVAGLFLAGFCLAVVFGARTYADIVAERTQNSRTRALLSYLTTCARANDTAGAVRIVYRQEAPVLVMQGGDTGYCLRIYQYGGWLVEDYGWEDADLNPSAAQRIGETESFHVEEVAENTYAVTTDAGRVLFHARCDAAEATEAVADDRE